MPSPAKAKKRISKGEFVKRLTDLTIQHFSNLPVDEQEKRMQAAERRLGISDRAIAPKPASTEEIQVIPLVARSHHE